MPCLDSGALILNRPALERLAETTSCKECPYVGSDSIAFGYCALVNAVPLVHVPCMHCHSRGVMGDSDSLLTADLMRHHWVTAGGLSLSSFAAQVASLAEEINLPHHPFEPDF